MRITITTRLPLAVKVQHMTSRGGKLLLTSPLLVIALLLVACDSNPAPIPPPAPTMTFVPPIGPTMTALPTAALSTWNINTSVNISKEELERARAKWHSRGIQAYEMTFHLIREGGWVNEDVIYALQIQNSEAKILSVIGLNGTTQSTPEPYSSDLIQFYTVEALFQQLGQAIERKANSHESSAIVYFVKFDDEMGYPVEFSSDPIGIDDASKVTVQVKQLEILQQR